MDIVIVGATRQSAAPPHLINTVKAANFAYQYLNCDVILVSNLIETYVDRPLYLILINMQSTLYSVHDWLSGSRPRR